MDYDLKPKEYEIMKFIWENAAKGVVFGDIHAYVNSLGKKESRQRVNCFIQSLIMKGILSASGEARHKIYAPTISKQEYDSILANKLLKQLFSGSLKTFVAALSGGESLSEETAEELRKILKERKPQK